MYAAPDGRWFADIDLRPDGSPVELDLVFENGGHRERTEVSWKATNLIEEPVHTVRQGDSLRLTATDPERRGNPAAEKVRITVEGEALEFRASDPVPYRFDHPGEIALGVTHSANGATRSFEAVVTVVPAPRAESPVFVPGFERRWNVEGLAGDVGVEWDDRVILIGAGESGKGTTRYHFKADAPFGLHTLFRLGEAGPVLGAAPMRRVTLHDGDETGTSIVGASEGTYLVDMPVVLSPVYDDVTVRYSIFVGGVTYGDGSGPDLELHPGDFGEFGQTVVEFLKLTTVQNSICHRAGLWQGEEQVADFN
jgi:hypothetical protein